MVNQPASSPIPVPAALGPVRDELLRAARADARALLARADRDAENLLARARAEAAALLEEARRRGEADGVSAARDVLAHARREARGRELAARREAYEELGRRVLDHVRELRDSPDHPAVLTALRTRAHRLLGPGAEITVQPDGGLVARRDGRLLDYSLDTLAARAWAAAGADAEELWTA
jgi:vacuolar-type H+-ATPase subunit E/Vma4